MPEHILLRHRDIPDLHKLDVYLKNGGYEAFKKVVTTLTPQQVIDEVKAAGLRGRGFTFALVLSSASQGFLFGHCETSKPENSRNARSSRRQLGCHL